MWIFVYLLDCILFQSFSDLQSFESFSLIRITFTFYGNINLKITLTYLYKRSKSIRLLFRTHYVGYEIIFELEFTRKC